MKIIHLHTIVNYTDRLHNHGYSAVADGSITADQINHDGQYGLNLTVSVDESIIDIYPDQYGALMIAEYVGDYISNGCNLRGCALRLQYNEDTKTLYTEGIPAKGLHIIASEEV